MNKMRWALLPVLLIVFSAIVLPGDGTKAMALGNCEAPGQKTGFSVGSQTRGSVVTLCGKVVANHTTDDSALLGSGKIGVGRTGEAGQSKDSASNRKPVSSRPRPAKPLDAEQKLRLWHRLLARKADTSFSPTALIIFATPKTVRPNQPVAVAVQHSTQHRTAYLLGRYVALRFTPTQIDLHFDKGVRVFAGKGFARRVAFKTRGVHVVRGIATYVAEFRVTGTKTWQKIIGSPQLAAISTKVLVAQTTKSTAANTSKGSKPLLVANDCHQKSHLAGCLN